MGEVGPDVGAGADVGDPVPSIQRNNRLNPALLQSAPANPVESAVEDVENLSPYVVYAQL